MKNRHRWSILDIEGQFGSEFPAICNHCGLRSYLLIYLKSTTEGPDDH